MSTLKAALKAAKAALDSQKYAVAVDEANKALNVDKHSYHAHVFLGLALEKRGQDDASEAAYLAAVSLKEKEPLAWQGLVTLYEKQLGTKSDRLHDAVLKLAKIFENEDDRTKCQTLVDKYTLDAKKYGSRDQYKHSLEILLPSSPIFDFLEGRILQPATTFIRIAEITDAEEKEKINSEIGQRRTRLGSRIDQVTLEVKREVLENSPLESYFGEIINWTQDDEVRREYEEKLLKRAADTLAVLPIPKKASKREQVEKLARGLVILKHPFLLAWRIMLEWSDVEELTQFDFGILQDFVALFPEDGLSKVIKGFLESESSPFPKIEKEPDSSSENETENAAMTVEERLILMTEGLEESPTSPLSHRLMSQYYTFLEESESVVKVAREGLQRISSESAISGLNFVNSSDALQTDLATALVHYQAPRHHSEARSLFENILKRRPSNVAALMGIGLIFEEQEDFLQASNFLKRAVERNNGPKIRSEAAWCKALNGQWGSSVSELQACLQDLGASESRTKGLRAQILYRIGVCTWNLDSSAKARKDRKGAYNYFIASLQADLNFAPAYTSLGIFYADYTKDRKRAKKCFLKAFELSVSELEAAERLANILANSAEWEEVEAVAQRVITSGRYRAAPGSKKKSLSWPFAAQGVVQLTNQDYTNSIVSFQSALRISPDDYHTWIGLGESYHNSGRYVAATRAFEHAEKVKVSSGDKDSSSWFSMYMLANVKRELGEYEDAVNRYREALNVRPNEVGVMIALLQCLVEFALNSVDLGFFGRSADLAVEAINVAGSVTEIQDNLFNLWKALGDACSIFIRVPGHLARCPFSQVRTLLEQRTGPETFECVGKWDHIDERTLKDLLSLQDSQSASLESCASLAILAYKRAVHTSANDIHVRAVAWYNLGCGEYLAHTHKALSDGTSRSGKASSFLRTAVQCFKKAIEYEAKNAEFWNALGVSTQEMSPRVAQHAFVRSLYLNDKSAQVWTNLGGFYLQQNDLQLANEAFTKAQSAGSDHSAAWLGQGLLARKLGDSKEAWQLFTHAYEISSSSATLVKQLYGLSSFDHVVSGGPLDGPLDLLQPLLGLRQLQEQLFENFPFRHLSALFSERIGDCGNAVSLFDSVSDHLEMTYEQAESPELLLQFVQVKADLARTQLAIKDFVTSAGTALTALDLSSDIEGHDDEVHKVRLSAHMTAGLSYYYQGSMEEALQMFRTVLNETSGNADVVCLLSQVLWAKGGEDEQGIAREQLLNCLEKDAGHVGVSTLLGAIALLDGDVDTLEAIVTDLQGLRAEDSLTTHQLVKINDLLTFNAQLYGDNSNREASEMAQATSAIMIAPSKALGWARLSETSSDPGPAETALLTSMKSVPPRGALEAQDICKIYSGSGEPGNAQRAVMFAPWLSQGWEALTESVPV